MNAETKKIQSPDNEIVFNSVTSLRKPGEKETNSTRNNYSNPSVSPWSIESLGKRLDKLMDKDDKLQ